MGKTVDIRYDPYDLSRVFIYHEEKYKQTAYPQTLRSRTCKNIPEENKKEQAEIRKSSIDFFTRLKQKELEINKDESRKIDFSKIYERSCEEKKV